MLSHTTGTDWQSFELRMRRRRADRLALRADIAADAGCPDDAREYLEEARSLAPGLPELALIEAKLARASRQPVAATLNRTILAAACVAAMVGGAAMARTTSAPAAPAPITTRPISDLVPAPMAETPAPALRVAAIPSTPLDPAEPLREGRMPPAPTVEPLPVVRKVEPAVVTATNVRTPPTVMDAASRVTTTAAAAPTPAPAPVAPIPTVPAALAEIPRVSLAVTPPAVTPAVTPAEPPQDSVVRSVLSRYASAYSSLDADAAERVWPGVNRAALSRAFDSLASQRISLGDCRVDVAGSSARAHCAGSATWAPKVGGGGTRTEARDWTFELARAASGWQIVSARVQNK